MSSGGVDYYRILGVSRSASMAEVRRRYQILAKKYHPDHGGDDNLMMLINRAYQTLSDPQSRIRYNRQLDSREPEAPHPTPPSPARPSSSSRFSQPGPTDTLSLQRKPRFGRVIGYALLGILLLMFLAGRAHTNSASTGPQPNISSTSQETPTQSASPAFTPTSSAQPTTTNTTSPSSFDSTIPSSSLSKPSNTSTYSPSLISSPTNCSTNSIGSFDYTNCFGSGGSTSCTTNNIGTTGYTNCY